MHPCTPLPLHSLPPRIQQLLLASAQRDVRHDKVAAKAAPSCSAGPAHTTPDTTAPPAAMLTVLLCCCFSRLWCLMSLCALCATMHVSSGDAMLLRTAPSLHLLMSSNLAAGSGTSQREGAGETSRAVSTRLWQQWPTSVSSCCISVGLADASTMRAAKQ
jgi:hypothetical protein